MGTLNKLVRQKNIEIDHFWRDGKFDVEAYKCDVNNTVGVTLRALARGLELGYCKNINFPISIAIKLDTCKWDMMITAAMTWEEKLDED